MKMYPLEIPNGSKLNSIKLCPFLSYEKDTSAMNAKAWKLILKYLLIGT